MKAQVKFFGAVAAVAIALVSSLAPALARESYVVDDASMFKSATISRLNGEIGDFQRTTGKEIVVVTTPSLDGKTLDDAAEAAFAKQQVNGVLFYYAKAEKKDLVVGDRASKAFFPQGSFTNIHDAMRGYLRDGDADQAILTGVSLVLDQYRSHERGLVKPATTTYRVPTPSSSTSSFGGGMSLLWLAIILFAGFLIIRAIFRAIAGPRPMPPGYGGPGMGGPGYGPPGYGGGYGPGYGGGGGGGFFSGLLGGLGGAFIGNELFGNRGGNTIIEQGGNPSGVIGDGSSGADNAGWQSDAGQADMGGAGGGSWGDSGGGFDSGGGGGDFGGGGDSGGGW